MYWDHFDTLLGQSIAFPHNQREQNLEVNDFGQILRNIPKVPQITPRVVEPYNVNS